jgi:hypothetical protein
MSLVPSTLTYTDPHPRPWFEHVIFIDKQKAEHVRGFRAGYRGNVNDQ